MTETGHPIFVAFLQEMRKLGFVEGDNLVINRWSGNAQPDSYDRVARDIVASWPDVIYAIAASMCVRLAALTTTIPIVIYSADPVRFGLVSNLAHPGGNVTGFTPQTGRELEAKRLQLLAEAAPHSERIAYLAPREYWEGFPAEIIGSAADKLGIMVVPAILDPPINDATYERAFAEMARNGVDAVLVAATAENYQYVDTIADLVQRLIRKVHAGG